MIHVVVADDEQKVSQLICNLIDWGSLGMQVVGVAENGLEALALVEQKQPHLLITDIRMPGCDGLELVKRAKKVDPNLEIIIISGYRFFDYAQTAIKYGVGDYLLKPVNKADLTATLEKVRARHRERTQQLSNAEQLQHRLQEDIGMRRAGLFRLVEEGPKAVPKDIDELNATYQYAFCPGEFMACVARTDGSYEELAAGGLSVVQEKNTALLREALDGLCFDYDLVEKGASIRMLLNYAPENRDVVRKALLGALDEMRAGNAMFPGVVFTVALGSAHDGPAGLPNSVAAARYTANQRLVEGGNALLDCREKATPCQQGPALLAAAGRALEAALEIQDEAAVLAAVEEFSTGLLAQNDLSGDDVLYLSKELFADYLAGLRKAELQLGEADALYESFANTADMCAGAKAVFAALQNHIKVGTHAALAAKLAADNKPIRTAKQFIHENYMRPLTLDEVAGAAGFNASYFSSLFKKETGQTFTEYLSDVRMAKAKELLRETNDSVAMVCEQVGYSDIKYFTKSFKKATGLKPGEFRKLYS